MDENKARHLRDHCKLGVSGAQLLSLEEGERIIAAWVNEINAADTRANGCHGMTRQAAYLQFQPKDVRLRPSQEVTDLAFAQKIERTVRVGGVIEIDGDARYSSPQPLARVGEKVMIVLYRRDKSRAFISLPESREAIEAPLRVPVGTKETSRRLEETAKLLEARALLAREESPLGTFEDVSEEEAADVRSILPRSMTEPIPSVGRIKPADPDCERRPLPYFGEE